MMFSNNLFTKDKIEKYLIELGKEFRKRGKGISAEIILVGGASVIINYNFRQTSFDIDGIYNHPSIMKESINAVGDKYGLPNGWLNDEFRKTKSYTPKIIQYSKYYKTFSNVLMIRTVSEEYLIAMKLVSGRKYKSDLSDIAGIMYEKQKEGNPITFEQINEAVINLYGNWDLISLESKELLNKILNNSSDSLHQNIYNSEKQVQQRLKEKIAEEGIILNQQTAEEIVRMITDKQR